jgi:hypothetical protein
VPLDVFLGVGTDGGTVTVLSGEALDDEIAKAAAIFTGAPLGAPRPGAVLTRVGSVDLTPVVRRASTLEVQAPPATVAPPAPALPAPVAKRVQLQNAALVGPLFAHLRVLKAEDVERGLATGIVMEPDVTDTQGQVVSAADIERAMVYWACNGGSVDLMHSFEAITDERVDVVESWIERTGFDLGGYAVQPGTWVMTTKWQVDGRYWGAIKAGELNAYSIGGLGETVDVGAEPEG